MSQVLFFRQNPIRPEEAAGRHYTDDCRVGALPLLILAELSPQIDSLASPDSETQPNDMVLVAHGVSGDLERLSELKIRKSRRIICFQTTNQGLEIPSNTLILDTTAFERQMFRVGERPTSLVDPHTSLSRQAGTTLSLANLLRSLGVDTSQIVFHNSGNDAFAALVSLQLLLEPDTQLKKLRTRDEEVPLSPSSPKPTAPASPLRPVGDPREYPPVVRSGASRAVPASPVEVNTQPIAAEKPQLVVTATPEKAEEAATPVRGKGRRGRGRGGNQMAQQQQRQERDARVESAMRNLDL